MTSDDAETMAPAVVTSCRQVMRMLYALHDEQGVAEALHGIVMLWLDERVFSATDPRLDVLTTTLAGMAAEQRAFRKAHGLDPRVVDVYPYEMPPLEAKELSERILEAVDRALHSEVHPRGPSLLAIDAILAPLFAERERLREEAADAQACEADAWIKVDDLHRGRATNFIRAVEAAVAAYHATPAHEGEALTFELPSYQRDATAMRDECVRLDSKLEAARLDAARWALKYDEMSDAEFSSDPIRGRRAYVAVLAKHDPTVECALECSECGRRTSYDDDADVCEPTASDPRHADPTWRCTPCRERGAPAVSR